MPILATASGQRHIEVEGMETESDPGETGDEAGETGDQDPEDEPEDEGDNSLRLWWIGQ